MSKIHFDANVANTSKEHKMNLDINSEENVIRYNLMPSLQHISAVNIIIRFWCQPDVRHLMAKLFYEYGHYNYLRGENTLNMGLQIGYKVSGKVLQLPVPNRIRKILSNIVDPIGLEIYNWIRAHEYFIFSDCHSWHINLGPLSKTYMDYFVWTSRGRIDYKRTAKNLIHHMPLSDDDQYNLACTYCLEDDIAVIAPRVIGTLFLGSLDKHGMVYFWTAHITGDFTELDVAVRYSMQNHTVCSANESIFKSLMGGEINEVAVRYIWDKLSDEEKSRQCISVIKQSSSIDIHCFLLSQMNEQQQEGVFKACASKILLSLLDDWLWGKYFLPTLNHIRNVITEHHYYVILEGIVGKMEENHKDIEKYNRYRTTFKELWQCAPEHFKKYVLEHDNGFRGCNIFFRLFCERNVDIIQSLLLDLNFAEKRNIIFSDDGMNECHMLIARNQWNLLEMFIGHTLVSEHDVDHFKRNFVIAKGPFIVLNFIQNKEWNNIEKFEKWAFKSDDQDQVKEFRRGLTYSGICRDILKPIFANKGDFTDLERFFEWCSSGDEERVMRLKAEIPQLYFVEVPICKLIAEKRDERLEQILNWCFVHDQKRIDKFKQNFCYDYSSFEILELVINLIKQDDQLKSLESFVNWCFTNEQEINKFKGWMLHILKDTVGVCVELLRQGFFKLADEFINWCCNSSQMKIDNFKKHLMCHDDINYVFKQYHHNNKRLEEVISWFNPSKKTVKKFKEKYISVTWFKDILPLLNTYVPKRNLQGCNVQ